MEQELLILPEKMSSPKVLMGVHIARSLVSWEGGKSPLSYRSASWTDISRASGILKGPVVQKKKFLCRPLADPMGNSHKNLLV